MAVTEQYHTRKMGCIYNVFLAPLGYTSGKRKLVAFSLQRNFWSLITGLSLHSPFHFPRMWSWGAKCPHYLPENSFLEGRGRGWWICAHWLFEGPPNVSLNKLIANSCKDTSQTDKTTRRLVTKILAAIPLSLGLALLLWSKGLQCGSLFMSFG